MKIKPKKEFFYLIILLTFILANIMAYYFNLVIYLKQILGIALIQSILALSTLLSIKNDIQSNNLTSEK